MIFRYRLNIVALIVFFAGISVSAEIAVQPSVITGLNSVSAESRIVLSSPDIDEWVMEDKLNESRGVPFRIGAERFLPDSLTSKGQLDVDPDYGFIWRLAVTSPDALDIYLHLTDVNLPDNSELFIYGENEIESEVYTQRDVNTENSLWSWGSRGDTIILEWHLDVQDSVSQYQVPQIPFTVKSISHVYIDLESELKTREGNCHNDATCDASYVNQRDASAYIEFNDGGTYLCSGTMLNCQAADFTPYFLTANHCIPTNTVASTIKVWFFYHTLNCDDPAPSKGYRTVAGSTLLATATAQSGNGPDFSLLRLSNTDYSGVYFSGWDRSNQPLDTAVTAVHHPDGAYKRISYGTLSSRWYSGQYGVTWDRTSNPGVTEGGSSGGALFNDTTQRVVGQLWAGSSACNNQYGTDFYGRFSVSFTEGNLGQWLGNVNAIDGAYWNGSSPTATPVATNTPTPTRTATPTPTGTVTPTPTSNPDQNLSVDIIMPSTMYKPGDVFGCAIVLSNDSSVTYPDLPLFVILDVYGQLIFAPDFNEFSFYYLDALPGDQTLVIIPTFNWPSGAGNASDVYWYAALTDSQITRILGTGDVFSFGWTE